MRLFTTKEVCKKLGLSPNTLAGWVRDEVVTPSKQPTKQGSRDGRWSSQDYMKVSVVQKMVRAGIDRSLVKKVLDDQPLVVQEQLENGDLVFRFTLAVTIKNY